MKRFKDVVYLHFLLSKHPKAKVLKKINQLRKSCSDVSNKKVTLQEIAQDGVKISRTEYTKPFEETFFNRHLFMIMLTYLA